MKFLLTSPLLMLGLCTISAQSLAADSPTFYADALPLFEKNCVACHQSNPPRVGGISAPMSLENYDEAKLWAPLIKRALETGYMPPWGAHVRHKGTFKDDRYIDDNEKATLIAWVDSGALEGNPDDVVSQVGSTGGTAIPTNGWWIGDPDLVVGFTEPVYVPDDVVDWQPTIEMPVPEGAHTQPKWISKAELNSGGPWVHHIVSSHMGVGVPGRGPFTYPEGWGVLMPENPFVTVNMHYHKNSGPDTAVFDSTKAGFVFYEDGAVIDYVVETNLLPHRGWTIPAGDPNFEVKNTYQIDEDIFLLSMGPHMHYRGKAMRYELEYPDGEREVLLWVPKYDFNWQFMYEYKEPKFIPAGSTMHMQWWFDNSTDNQWNPDPSQDVVYGPETSDEMANARIYFAPATARGIIVGEEIPAEVLQKARDEDARRRERTRLDVNTAGNDTDWLNQDSQSR